MAFPDHSRAAGREAPIDADIVGFERALIGALMNDNGILAALPIRLLPEHFTLDRHRIVWRVALALIGSGQEVTATTVRLALVTAANVVDPSLDLLRMERGAAPALVGWYAEKVLQAFVCRRIAELREDVDRLMRALPDNVTTEMMGAYLFVRCGDIATQAGGFSFGGRALGGAEVDVMASLITAVMDVYAAADAEAQS